MQGMKVVGSLVGGLRTHMPQGCEAHMLQQKPKKKNQNSPMANYYCLKGELDRVLISCCENGVRHGPELEWSAETPWVVGAPRPHEIWLLVECHKEKGIPFPL